MTSWRQLDRRVVLAGGFAAVAAAASAATAGERLAQAAGAQVGVTTGYDPHYRRIAYPGGDVARGTGVCADVVVRAARDGLGLDRQRLVHEDMARAFATYPSRRSWGLTHPDANIDHRRVLNLEAYWRRQGAELWQVDSRADAHHFPRPLAPGDFLTWRVGANQPHVAVVSHGGLVPLIVHNIGGGTEEVLLATMWLFRASGHYGWPGHGS